MKTLLLGSVAVLALGTAANAADLSPKTYTKAPVAAPVSNWTGFYLFGGGGSGLWTADQQTSLSGPVDLPVRTGGRGYFGTVGGGYDYQFGWLNSTWVAGIFADAQFGDIKGTSNSYDGYYTGSTTNKTNYAVGARLGYLVAPNVLSYVNGGYSHADFSATGLYEYGGSSGYYSLPNRSYDGWFLGGGVENSLDLFGLAAPGWFMKTEYRVAEYGRRSVDVIEAGVPNPGWTVSSKPYVQTVSTALVYRFNSDGAPMKVASAPLYTKARVAAPYNWTGFYLSGGGGYGLWENDQQAFDGPGSTPERMGGHGYFGTVGGGYDWQFGWLNSSWIAGIFADAQFGDLKGSADWIDAYSGTIRNRLNYAAGVRLGYLVAPNVLSYVNAGYSHAEFAAADLLYYGGSSYGLLPKQHFDGWFLGGGVENSLDFFGLSASGWFVKTEYRLAEYGRKTADFLYDGGPALPGYSISSKPYVQTVSTSLVYRFNWGGAPITAKY